MSPEPRMINPIEGLLHWERLRADQVYLTQPLSDGSVVEYRWSQVADEARRMAHYLVSLELPPRSSIALLGKNSAHWIIADLAIWMAGHVSVPLYPTLNARTAAYILGHCEARLMFAGRLDGISDSWNEIRAVLPPTLPLIGLPLSPEEIPSRWNAVIEAQTPLKPLAQWDPEELASIVYTSGTTGLPKGVMLSFRALSAPCRHAGPIWQSAGDDRMLSYLPLAHVGERVAVEVPSLIMGYRVFFSDTLETFVQDLKRARPTRFFTVPRLWTKFYQGVNQKIPPERQAALFDDPELGPRVKRDILEGLGLDQVRVAMTAAAPMPAALVEWYRGLGLDLLDVFGMTENCATSHMCRAGEAAVGYVGTPLPGVECRIDDNGEVLVKSPGQMIGYYRDPELTASVITADGFMRTGDRGEVDSHGRLRVTGRVKELFKTAKGKYVAPVPIENQLVGQAGIEAACVTGPGQPQPFALLLLGPGIREQGVAQLQPQLEALRERINAELEDHECLSYLVVVRDTWTTDNGFLTPTMKIKRNVIEERYLGHADAWQARGEKVVWE